MLINLLGCDGCGKSTQLRQVIPWLEAHYSQPVRSISKKDALNITAIPEARYFGCDYHTLMFEILPEMRGASRALFIFNLLAIPLCHQPVQNDEIVILDGGWQKHVATEMALGLDEQWLTNLADIFPKPDLTIFLDVDPDTILEWRRQKNGTHAPYECGNQSNCSDALFLEQMNKVYRILLRQSREQNWTRIDGKKTTTEVFQAITQTITATFEPAR
ncbi:dTMP kinase [Klebsiella aerogenes]|uniref:dTMP kinase n=1 Tax=Klebsiella aerogenes TaxID=548 RepID=UPI0036BBA917